jgi:hypothetical protein
MKYEYEELPEYADKIKEAQVNELGIKFISIPEAGFISHYLVLTAIDPKGNSYYFQKIMGVSSQNEELRSASEPIAREKAFKLVGDLKPALGNVKLFNGRIMP